MRLFSFGLVLAISFLLIVSLAVSTVVTALTDFIKTDTSTFLKIIFHGLDFILSFRIISVLFALIYKYLPDIKIRWKYIWLGSLVTGILFMIGKTALTIYFEKASPGSAYGAAGSIILILLWVSYSSMIVFFGAEFTYQNAKLHSDEAILNEENKSQPQTDQNKNHGLTEKSCCIKKTSNDYSVCIVVAIKFNL